MSNQETNQKQIQFPAQQELKHLRTRCGKVVYALGNNRFRAVVQTTPVHEYDAATHQWVELSAEKRQRMAAQAHSPIAMFADSANSAENAAGILDTYVKVAHVFLSNGTKKPLAPCAGASLYLSMV